MIGGEVGTVRGRANRDRPLYQLKTCDRVLLHAPNGEQSPVKLYDVVRMSQQFCIYKLSQNTWEQATFRAHGGPTRMTRWDNFGIAERTRAPSEEKPEKIHEWTQIVISKSGFVTVSVNRSRLCLRVHGVPFALCASRTGKQHNPVLVSLFRDSNEPGSDFSVRLIN